MKVLVCGGRSFADEAMFEQALGEIEVTELIEGGASGADKLAREWPYYEDCPPDGWTNGLDLDVIDANFGKRCRAGKTKG